MMLEVPVSTAVAVEFVCLFISLVFVFLRSYVHARMLGRLTVQDGLIVFAWLSFMGRVLGDYYIQLWGFWDPGIQYTTYSWPDFEKYVAPGNLEKGFKLQYGISFFYFFSVYSVKASFFLLFHKIFPKDMVWLRKGLYLAIAFNAVGLVIAVFLGLFWCRPMHSNWSLDPMKRCLSWSHLEPYFFSVAFNIVSDLSIYILPFFLLPTLYRSASRGQFVGIVVVFSFGLLSLICMICKTAMVGVAARPDLVTTWTAAEMAAALIAACMPPLRRLRKVTIKAHLGSFSGHLPGSTPRSSSSKKRRASKGAEILVSRRDQDDGLEMEARRAGGGGATGQESNGYSHTKSSVKSALNFRNMFRGTMTTGSGDRDLETAGTGWTNSAADASVIRTRRGDYDPETGGSSDDVVMGGLAPPVRKISEPKPALVKQANVSNASASTPSSRDNSSERRRSRPCDNNNSGGGNAFWNKWKAMTSSSPSNTPPSVKKAQRKKRKDQGLPNLTFGSSKNRTNKTISQIDEEPSHISYLGTASRGGGVAGDGSSLDPMLGSTRETLSSHSEADRGRVMTMPGHQRRSVSPGFGFLSGNASPGEDARAVSVRTSSSLDGSLVADALSIEPVDDKFNRRSFGSIFGSPP